MRRGRRKCRRQTSAFRLSPFAFQEPNPQEWLGWPEVHVTLREDMKVMAAAASEGCTDNIRQGANTHALPAPSLLGRVLHWPLNLGHRAGGARRATVSLTAGGAGHVVFFEQCAWRVQRSSPAGPNPA